jgi:HTH-type transcriptional regulator/antitoxin HigA
MEKMTTARLDYARLLSEIQPAAVHEEQQNELYTEILEKLAFKKNPTSAEQKLIELLTLLIENFENESYRLEDVSPVQVISDLMEQNSLKQKDLVAAGIFETASVASEILNAKRDLTKEHIKRLSKYFNVSPLVFFEIER